MSGVTAGRDNVNQNAPTIINYFSDGKGSATASKNDGPPSTVPTPSPTFVPRTIITAAIHAALHKNPDATVIRQAVTRAMGGYGKTVAAILYAHEYENDYPGGRFFLSVESGDLVTGLASLTEPLGLASADNPAADAELVKRTLESAQPNLLILDNIVNAAQWATIVEARLVPRGSCRVLITTRAETIPQATIIRIGRLTSEEAREIYARFCALADVRDSAGRDCPTDATADAITDLVGGLAVAVAAVAACMKLRPDVKWSDYATLLATLPIDKLPDASAEVRAEIGADGQALKEHRRTLRIIDDALEALPAPELRAVQYAALLPADMVPLAWLVALLESDAARPHTGGDGAADLLALTLTQATDLPGSPALRVIKHLDALDLLLEAGEGGQLLSLHRLWHARVNERAEAAGEGAGAAKVDRTSLLRAIAACAFERTMAIVKGQDGKSDGTIDNPAALTDQSLRWELTPLAQMCTALWQAGQSGLAARVGVWLAGVLQLLGRYAEAAACLQLTPANEAAVEAAIGHEVLAHCYSNLALIQQDQGDLPEARRSCERAIAINSKHFAPDHLTFATSYSNLAMIQQDQGDLPGARASMEQAIAIQSKHFDPDNPTFAIRYSNLAGIQQDQGDLPGARASMERAIAIWSKHLAADHPNFGSAYSNLAGIQQAQGDLPGARASVERAIAIESKHFAPDHPNFATSYTNLATICYHEGDRAAACANFKKALAIFLKHFDDNHPNVKSVRKSMKNVGCGA